MKTQTQLRIGKIRYLNCLPFYFGLSKLLRERNFGPEVSFFESYPVAINKAMQDREIDAAPISSLEYLVHQDDYLLMPELAIGARLFARSVLLISKKKIESLNQEVIALSRESLSSASLLRILLKQKFGYRNTFDLTDQDPEVMLQKYQAALVIGDQAIFCQPKELVYKYDLGEIWQQWTGKPFVFSLWVVRREFAAQYPEQIRLLAVLLKENLLLNLSDPEALLKKGLGIVSADRRFCQLLGYFVNLQYFLDQDMTAGLTKFFECAHEEGLAPRPQPLRFFS